eukprot:COSAG06_NODE_676_length_13150_cov_3.664164_12_plen_374_part_00
MIESFVIARDRFMKKAVPGKPEIASGCNMYPSTSNIYLAPFCDEELYAEQYNKTLFFAQNDFEGVDLTALRGAALRSYFSQPIVDAFDPSLLLDSPVAHLLDFRSITDTELQRIEIPFRFTAAFTANMHGIAGWFDVEFLGSENKVVLTTAPGEPTTHWHQMRCMFQQPVFVMAGQTIAGTLLMQAHERQSYWMHVTLHEPIQVQNTMDLKEPHQRAVGFFVPPSGEENYFQVGTSSEFVPAPAAQPQQQQPQQPQQQQRRRGEQSGGKHMPTKQQSPRRRKPQQRQQPPPQQQQQQQQSQQSQQQQSQPFVHQPSAFPSFLGKEPPQQQQQQQQQQQPSKKPVEMGVWGQNRAAAQANNAGVWGQSGVWGAN